MIIQAQPSPPTFPKNPLTRKPPTMSSKIEKTIARQQQKYTRPTVLSLLLPNPANQSPHHHQNRRRPILRSAPAAARHRHALRQAIQLGCRHQHPSTGRAAAAPGRPGRQRRRPVPLPARSLPQSRDEARCRHQGEAVGLAAQLPAGRADQEALHQRDDRVCCLREAEDCGGLTRALCCRWSSKYGEYPAGDPDLHHVAGTVLAEGMLPSSQFVAAN